MRRSGLGRGLDALIPSEGAANGGTGVLQEVPIAQIEPNPLQPRQHFDEESLSGLAASIREVGILQPLLVRALESGQYELIAGERRWRAARRAGLATVPVLVREVDDVASLEQALVENLHRVDLGPLEEGAAYQQLIEDFGLTHDQLARRVGKSRAAVTNTLRLFQLPPTVQRLIGEGRLSAGHARALLGTQDRTLQETLARRCVAEGLSVRATEDLVRQQGMAGRAGVNEEDATHGPAARPSSNSPAPPTLRPPGVLELEELLSNHLDTRVKVQLGANRGQITIDFATVEDLERIYRRMTEAGVES